MFDQIPFMILRDIFEKIDKKDLLSFKLTTKRIFNFVTDDRVCQCVYLQKQFNLSFNDNLKELIRILDSKKYSRFFTQDKLLYKTEDSLFL